MKTKKRIIETSDEMDIEDLLTCRRFKRVIYKFRIIAPMSLWRSFNDPPMSTTR